MEKTLNLSAFETLDREQMMEVDGGTSAVAEVLGGFARDYLIGMAVNLYKKCLDNAHGYRFLDDYQVQRKKK
ncbi:MAG: hypothetical protein KBS74_00265 [Clostridiales bacterium]|nr:hypothetical protein [Candidatus Cacconaster stercorequi]